MRTPLAPASIEASGRAEQRWPFGLGPRGFLLLAIGLLWIVPAWIDRRLLILMVAWDALVIVAWAIDVRRLPAAGHLHVRRRWDGPLGLDTPARVTLELRHDGALPIQARVTDFASVDLLTERADTSELRVPDLPTLTIAAPPRAEVTAGYDILPRERGDHAMGAALVRYRSDWGLATRWATVPLAQAVRVYPNLKDAQRQVLFLVRSRQQAIEKRRARERGAGREFESLREYQDGDEPRDISWTASARRGKLVTRRYQPERSQTVWILVDAGRLLRARVGAAQHTKLDYGVNSALALAQVAMASGDRVGLLAYGHRAQQRVAPGRGPLHVRALVDALAAVRAEAVEADHVAAASTVMAMQKRRALIVWLTEVAETAGVPDVIESSRRMAPRHVVLLGFTRQPELGALAAARPETEAQMYRVMAAQQTVERREELLYALRQRGVLTVEFPPGELSAALVDRYLTIKARSVL